MSKRFPWTVWAIALVAICLASSTAVAQFGESKGNLYGKVVDEQGGVLPGVTVTLSGQGAPTIATTDARGEFRFLNLSPGTYTVKLDLTGFAVVTRENVAVSLGRNTEIRESLKLSSVAAAVTVTSETPVIDTRKVRDGCGDDQRRVARHPQRARPVGAAAERSGRPGGPGQRGRLRERPAVHLQQQGDHRWDVHRGRRQLHGHERARARPTGTTTSRRSRKSRS